MSEGLNKSEVQATITMWNLNGDSKICIPVRLTTEEKTHQESLFNTVTAEDLNGVAKRFSKRLRKMDPHEETKAKVTKLTADSDVHGRNQNESNHVDVPLKECLPQERLVVTQTSEGSNDGNSRAIKCMRAFIEKKADFSDKVRTKQIASTAGGSDDVTRRHSERLSVRNKLETKAQIMKSESVSDNTCGKQDQSIYARSQRKSQYEKLISRDELRMLFKKHKENKHTDFKKKCENIRSHILKHNPKIKEAWPSYDSKEETSIVFVLIYDSIKDLETDNCDVKYDYIKRLRCQRSPEEELIAEHMKSNDVSLSDKESKKIDQCMKTHAVRLMKSHKFLSIISKSAVRSSKNGSQITREPCITLYVHTKTCIPIDEEPFKKKYGGVPVDVREGTFTMYTNPPEAYQDNLTMGCQIGCSNGSGSLGGFIEHPKYGLCGLTAAHVLFAASYLQVLAEGSGKQEMNEFGSTRFVYQPADTRRKIGKAVTVVQAIFTIEKRPPLSGQPAGTHAQRDRFESGQIFESSWIHTGKDAIKFGYKTSKTQAKFANHLDHISVKVVDGTKQEFNVTMHNQIAVKSKHFASCGDSGSLVFTRLFDGRLACVGLLIGGSRDGLVVITPITPILRAFGVTSLKHLMIDKNVHELCVLQEKVDSGFDFVKKHLRKLTETMGKIEKKLPKKRKKRPIKRTKNEDKT